MNRRFLAGVLAAAALAVGVYGYHVWRDIHPKYATTAHELEVGYSVELPLGWPKPDEEFGLVDIGNNFDKREESLDQFHWSISIRDHGVDGQVEKVIEEFRPGDDSATRIRDVVLANGVVAKTWTYVMPMVELSQEHRVYVFKAPNGHVYSALLPMMRGWVAQRRYENLFRAVLGSMKFK